MTDYYVNSGGGAPSSPYANWTDAAATVVDAITAGAGADDTIYVHTGATNPHSESINAADVSWNGPSTTGDKPLRIIGVDKDNSDAYTISSTANATLSSTYDLNVNARIEVYGLRFAISGTGYFSAGSASPGYFQDCYFDASSGTPTYYVYNYSKTSVVYKDCTFTNGSDNSYVNSSYTARTTYIGCTFSGGASTYQIYALSGMVALIGCDLSGWPATSFAGGGGVVTAMGCRLNSTAGLGISGSSETLVMSYESDTDSGNSSYRNELQTVSSTRSVLVDTSNSRSGGATYDGTNGYSYVISGPATAEAGMPTAMYSDWNTGFLSNTGERTFTVYIANATADYDDTQIWLEVEYFGSASNTLKTIATDGETDPTVAIGSGTVQTDDTSSTWSPAKTYMQKLEVTATIARPGSFRFRVGSRVATDIYIDPVPEIT